MLVPRTVSLPEMFYQRGVLVVSKDLFSACSSYVSGGSANGGHVSVVIVLQAPAITD